MIIPQSLLRPLYLGLGLLQSLGLEGRSRSFSRVASVSLRVVSGLEGSQTLLRLVSGSAQRLQYPLIKECSLNHIKDPTII